MRASPSVKGRELELESAVVRQGVVSVNLEAFKILLALL